jgi:hypothetical protein
MVKLKSSIVEYLKIKRLYVIFCKLFGFLNKSLDICQTKEKKYEI